jgi:hypothetical protein
LFISYLQLNGLLPERLTQGLDRVPPAAYKNLDEVRQHRRQYISTFPKKPPSSQAVPHEFSKLQENHSHAIDCNRPSLAAATIPVTLLHVIFGQFVDDCTLHTPTKEDNGLVLELSTAMSCFFTDENARLTALIRILKSHHIYLAGTRIAGTLYDIDADIQFSGHRGLILEAKNEIASNGAEPYIQHNLYYYHSTKDAAESDPTSNFPCLLVAVFGKF